MKISYNWLKKFIKLDDISPEKLAHDLSLFGHEVESLKKIKDDYILDFEITPNRGDCLSIIGIAREISALYDRKLNIPKTNVVSVDIAKKIKINIQDPKICQRFSARIIDNISIKKSPHWIIDKLKYYGFRPLNNIVDITNYIMIETGQPLHAFDFDKISNGIVDIKCSSVNDSIITLDGKENILNKNSIIIKDDKKIYDLAGIMGGFNSQVDEKTKTILLQGSVFDPVLIRRTSKYLNKNSDASYRFERGVDTDNTVYAVDRASMLIKRICPKCKIGRLNDVKFDSKIQKITINPYKINHLLGIKISKDIIKKYLNKLNIKYIDDYAIIPTYRSKDITIWQDIAEEIARIHGYNNLGINYFKKEKITINNDFTNKESLKDLLVNHGFVEVYSHSFADEKIIKLLNYHLSNCETIINPIAPENKYLRPSLEPSIIKAVAKNPWAPQIDIFEIGKIFYKNEEKWQLGIATNNKKAENIKSILSKLNIKVEIKSVPQNILDYLKIRKQIKYAVIDLTEIKKLNNFYLDYFSNINYKRISDYPPTIRDLAFIADISFDAEKILDEISNLDKHILFVELFDEFASDKFGKNKKNVAYHIWLQDYNGPITSQKSDIIVNMIIKHIENKYNIKLR